MYCSWDPTARHKRRRVVSAGHRALRMFDLFALKLVYIDQCSESCSQSNNPVSNSFSIIKQQEFSQYLVQSPVQSSAFSTQPVLAALWESSTSALLIPWSSHFDRAIRCRRRFGHLTPLQHKVYGQHMLKI